MYDYVVFDKRPGPRMKAFVKYSGLRQKEIARQMGVNPSYLSRVLSGRDNPSEETIKKFCQVLGLTDEHFYQLVFAPKSTSPNKYIVRHT